METPSFLRAPVDLGRRVAAHPWLTLACAAFLVLVCAWIAWAVHVGSEHGADAAIGVLISWPLLFFLAAALVVAAIGILRLARGSTPEGGRDQPPGGEQPAPRAEAGSSS